MFVCMRCLTRTSLSVLMHLVTLPTLQFDKGKQDFIDKDNIFPGIFLYQFVMFDH